jgi:hypothetical protein
MVMPAIPMPPVANTDTIGAMFSTTLLAKLATNGMDSIVAKYESILSTIP